MVEQDAGVTLEAAAFVLGLVGLVLSAFALGAVAYVLALHRAKPEPEVDP